MTDIYRFPIMYLRAALLCCVNPFLFAKETGVINLFCIKLSQFKSVLKLLSSLIPIKQLHILRSKLMKQENNKLKTN